MVSRLEGVSSTLPYMCRHWRNTPSHCCGSGWCPHAAGQPVVSGFWTQVLSEVLAVVGTGAVLGVCAAAVAGVHALQVARQLHSARPGGGLRASLLHIPSGTLRARGIFYAPQALRRPEGCAICKLWLTRCRQQHSKTARVQNLPM